MSSYQLKKEIETNNQLAKLGLISDVERQAKNIKAKYLRVTYLKDCE